METTRVKLNDGSVVFAESVDVANGVMRIKMGDRYTCEQAQELFSDKVKLSHMQLMTIEDDDVYGVYGGYTELQGVTLFGDCKCVELCKLSDNVIERIVSAEASVLRMLDKLNKIESGELYLENHIISDAIKMSRLSAQTVSDNEAITMKSLYPSWQELVESRFTAKDAGYKFTYHDALYKTASANIIFQHDWIPGQGTESLFTVIDETHSGDINDPIPAKAGMEYVKGKYYIDGEYKYLMSRQGMNDGDAVVLHYLPSQLENVYFTKVEKSDASY